MFENVVRKLSCCKLAALISVDDLGCAVLSKCLLDDLDRMAGRERGGQLVRHHPVAGNINHSNLIRKPMSHGNIGRVQRPGPVGRRNGAMPEPVGKNLVAASSLEFTDCGCNAQAYQSVSSFSAFNA